MNKLFFKTYIVLAGLLIFAADSYAGNPDRQGEAGAAELLLNPWGRSGGLHSLNTASITGVESMRLNIAGLGRITGRQLVVSNSQYLVGSDIKLNSFGYAQKSGENGSFGISLMAVDFGEINVTTTSQPEGTGATYSPSFFNMGLGYSYTYDNKISVGLLVRGVSEALPQVSAFGFAIDAGVQYVSGANDNFKLGISLRNIGSPMKFAGQGLTFKTQNPDSETDYLLTVSQESGSFEMPSMLNIGISYDFLFGEKARLSTMANFTSNAFSRDEIGVAAEFSFKDMFMLRAGYKTNVKNVSEEVPNLYSGLSAGASIEVPFNESGKNKIGVDYGYRATSPFRGTHNVSIRFSF